MTSKDSGTNQAFIRNQTRAFAIQAIQLTSDSVQGKLRSAVVSAASLWCFVVLFLIILVILELEQQVPLASTSQVSPPLLQG